MQASKGAVKSDAVEEVLRRETQDKLKAQLAQAVKEEKLSHSQTALVLPEEQDGDERADTDDQAGDGLGASREAGAGRESGEQPGKEDTNLGAAASGTKRRLLRAENVMDMGHLKSHMQQISQGEALRKIRQLGLQEMLERDDGTLFGNLGQGDSKAMAKLGLGGAGGAALTQEQFEIRIREVFESNPPPPPPSSTPPCPP